ncbi:MAG: hypothetical protein KTR21_06640, partial [Rhodobacteraceae bacterium]|nr:hypothetical protein [Paracoccaceae bacterium]
MSDTTPDAVDGGTPAESPKVRWFTGLSLRAITMRSTYRRISKVLYVMRAPLVTALLGVIAFAVPGQTREIYWLFAEDFNLASINADANLRLMAFLGLLFVTGYVLWYHARALTLADADSFEALHRESGAEAWIAKWAPRIVGAAPSFAAAIGMSAAASVEPLFGPGNGELLERLSRTVALLYGAAFMAMMIGVFLLWSSWRRSKRDPNVYDDVRRTAFRSDLRLISAAAVLGFMAFMMTMPIGFFQIVGALSIMCLFMICLSFGLTVLSYIYDRHAVPLITLLLIGVV